MGRPASVVNAKLVRHTARGTTARHPARHRASVATTRAGLGRLPQRAQMTNSAARADLRPHPAPGAGALLGGAEPARVGTHLAFLGLGSNLGPRARLLARALRLLACRGIVPCAWSSIYESAPLGPWPDQPPFLNAVVAVRTQLGAEALLRAMLGVERALGRRRLRAQGPRLIDLDLLLYDEDVRPHGAPTLPHPRLCERAFVLRPLLELRPKLCHPCDGLPLARHLAATAEQRLVRRGLLARGLVCRGAVRHGPGAARR